METIMGSHLTNAAKLSNDWGPPQPSCSGSPGRGLNFVINRLKGHLPLA